MAYIKRIVCLANSFKPGGSCIAGRELTENGFAGWVRPVSTRPTAAVSASESRYENNTNPKLLDIIDVPLLEAVPHNHQTENHMIDVSHRWVKVGELPWAALAQIRDTPTSLWINRDHTKGSGYFDCMSQAEAVTLHDSLVLIKPDNFSVEIGTSFWTGQRKYRGDFYYNGTHYNLSLTDPVAISAFGAESEGSYPLNDVYVCVSLTEPYDKDGRCHKLVAAIFRNPPL